MKNISVILAWLLIGAGITQAQIAVNPSGVNVNANGATTVFLTFGRVADKVPVEAFWCGELIDAAPDIGKKCAPGTIFGQLPIRYDLSKVSANGNFTDIMSIPPSVSRRAYQAAQQGSDSRFFYVRRFVNPNGGPDEYVAVTCRLAGGGARVPFSLLNVNITADTDLPLLFVKKGEKVPSVIAEIYYNGTGQLKGRWEIVLPGDELPDARDLLPEASLPIEERHLQRRYTQISRFNVFLPPIGKIILPGPDAKKIPTKLDGLHMILLRIEASADKEGDSNIGSVGGTGLVHSGAVAGFPLPPFRYHVGQSESKQNFEKKDELTLLLPQEGANLPDSAIVEFGWAAVTQAALYHLEVKNGDGEVVLAAYVQPGTETYEGPDWLQDRADDGRFSWRIAALNFSGKEIQKSSWRAFSFQ